MFEFEWWPLIFLLPLPWLVKLGVKKQDTTDQSLTIPFYSQLSKVQLLHKQGHAFNLNHLLLTLAWIFLLLAAMKPIWVDEGLKLPVKGRDIMLAIDLSGSMKQNDFVVDGRRVNRLHVVKKAAKVFVNARKKDRIGLIVFGSQAFLYAPLTFDKNLILQYLAESQIAMAGQQTAIGDAIVVAIKHFRDNKKQDNEERTLVLLTDGTSNAGAITPQDATQLAKEENIKVYTIGMGNAGGGFFRQGIDEATLKTIAKQTGGLYFRARDTNSLKAIYQAIDKLEQKKVEDKFYRPRLDLFYYPLTLFLFLLSFLLIRKNR